MSEEQNERRALADAMKLLASNQVGATQQQNAITEIRVRHELLEAKIVNLEKSVEKHSRLVEGNGKPGMIERMTSIEHVLEALVKVQEKESGFRQKVVLIGLGQVATVLVGVIVWAISQGAGG